MKMYAAAVLLCALAANAQPAQKPSATTLIAQAAADSTDLKRSIPAAFSPAQLAAGTAVATQGPDAFFAITAAAQPTLLIDDAPGPPMQPVADVPNTWFAVAHIVPVAHLHAFSYVIAGKPFGGSLDLPIFGPLSYPMPGVPQGTLSAKLQHISKIYDGMKSDYWIYVPAQYDPKTPAALMVFQDGHNYIHRDGNIPALTVIDNLIALKKIPVMICLFTSPGSIEAAPGTPTHTATTADLVPMNRTMTTAMRSIEYDSVDDRYPRFLRDELIPLVAAQYNLRTDAYSHGITGASSGGIASFNAAFQMPTYFSRVISWIGSYTGLQTGTPHGSKEGGQDYPNIVLREPARNIRVWLQDGANDQENVRVGSWPLANIALANALKSHGYDFHLSFGKGTHNNGHGSAQFPEEMTWLWRDYDPTLTTQTFTQDPAEKTLPYFRVAITTREADLP